MNVRNSNRQPVYRQSSSSSVPISAQATPIFLPPARKVLSPGEWMRAMSGFDAPFGFDRMPTVFG